MRTSRLARRVLLVALAALCLAVPGSEAWSGAVAGGDRLASEHRLLSGVGRYQEAVHRPGGALVSLVRLGSVYLRRGQAREGVEAFGRARSLGAVSREALLGLAAAQEMAGDPRSSLETLRQALAFRPGDGEAWSRLVDRGARSGLRPREVAQMLRDVPPPAVAAPANQEAAYLLGACVLGAESEEGGAALRRAALGSDTQIRSMAQELLDAAAVAGDASARATALGSALLGQGLVGPALYALEPLAADRPAEAEGLALRGYALMRAGYSHEAEDAFRRSHELAADRPLVEFLEGSFLRLEGDAEGAMPLLEKAAKRDPGNPAVYLELADALATVGDYGNAAEALKLAVRAAPDSAEVRLAAVRFHTDRQFRIDEALDDAREAVRTSRRSAVSLDALGWALNLSGKPQEALDPLLEAVAKDPESAGLRYRLGSVYEALQQAGRAREQFLMVRELDGTGADWRRASEALVGLEQQNKQ